jgi:hypothetical protein
MTFPRLFFSPLPIGLILGFWCGGVSGLLSAEPQVTSLDFSSAVPLGKWTGFYRGTQVQGNGLQGRLFLRTVPDYLLKGGSFPYQPRPYPEEVLFADRLSFVRFVGGWNKNLRWGEDRGTDQGDLAYRLPNGTVAYRWEKIAPRIDPYLQAGYRAPIIALDNVPWQLAAYPSAGVYGQNAPAKDVNEWAAFIRGFFEQLRTRYGLDLVRHWMFRMGTEPNGGVGYVGSHDDFLAMYSATAHALHEVIPGAMFGPGEFAGGLLPSHPPSHGFDYLRFADQQGKLAVPTLPFDYIANSAHDIPKWRGTHLVGGVDPRDRVASSISSFNELRKRWPALKNDPVYIFQFGILNSEVPDPDHPGEMVVTDEPGGRGAAWTFDTILGFKQLEPRLAGIWHWDVGDDLPADNRNGAFILHGNGWLYQIFDQFRGGDAFVLPTTEVSPGHLVKAFLARKDGVGYLLLSNFSPDRRLSEPEEVRVSLPTALCGGIRTHPLSQLVLSEENCPMKKIKDVLRQAGLLVAPYSKTPVLAGIAKMSGRPGVDFTIAHLKEFEALVLDSLTLKPFTGTATFGASGTALDCTLPRDSVTLIALGRPAAAP